MVRFCTTVLAVIVGSLAAQAQTAKISEPIFGIQYSPQVVHFDNAPQLIGQTCKDMRGKTLSVYASIRDHDIQYFIVQEPFGEFGVAIAIEHTRCAEIDLDRFLYEGIGAFAERGIAVRKDDNRRILESVSLNIVSEYSKAFGGRDKFLNALGTRADSLPDSILRTEIENITRNK